MTILLLAGSGEARVLASELAAKGVPVIASLAGAVRQPTPLDVPVRIGGFGGADGFTDFLSTHHIAAVIDATHPFAAQITARTAAICADRGLPYLRLERPGWCAGPGDNWIWIDREEDAVLHISDGATVFLATGRQTLDHYAGLAGCTLYCRQIDPATRAFPFSKGGFVIGRPPFPVADEIALFQRLGNGWLVVKDAGGVANRTKLDAARALGLPVLIIRRPAPPFGITLVETVAAALDWVAAL